MNKAIIICLSFLVVGCLVEEKHYHGCDADITCCMPEDTITDPSDVPDTTTDTKDFLDLFEEVSETK